MQKLEIQNFITKKIGSTTYVVSVSFSDTSKENFNDKLLRLVNADDSVTKKKEEPIC